VGSGHLGDDSQALALWIGACFQVRNLQLPGSVFRNIVLLNQRGLDYRLRLIAPAQFSGEGRREREVRKEQESTACRLFLSTAKLGISTRIYEMGPPHRGHLASPPTQLNNPALKPHLLHLALATTVVRGPPFAATSGPPQPGHDAAPPIEAYVAIVVPHLGQWWPINTLDSMLVSLSLCMADLDTCDVSHAGGYSSDVGPRLQRDRATSYADAQASQ
jgi:hypothetical protein